MDERKYEYWKENHTKCKHDLYCVKSCRECLFETLCRLEEIKENKTQKL